MKDIETPNYRLAVGTGPGAGTFIIIRAADNATTLRNTGSEALEQYKLYETARGISPEAFDALCKTESYEQ